MLKWAFIFLGISIAAGIFGFKGLQGLARNIARVLFFIFVVLFLVFLFLGISIF